MAALTRQTLGLPWHLLQRLACMLTLPVGLLSFKLRYDRRSKIDYWSLPGARLPKI